MPALSSTMTEGKIASWVKTEGDTDMDVDTFYDGYLPAIIVDEGAVASAIALLAETQSESAQAKSKATTCSPSPPPSPVSDSPPAAEGGKRIVGRGLWRRRTQRSWRWGGFECGIEWCGGEWADGEDLSLRMLRLCGGASGGVKAAPGIELGSVVSFTTMQSAVSRNMVESLLFQLSEWGITTDALDPLYKKIKLKGVTMTALLAKATALAFLKHPVVNSSSRDGKNFTYNSSINIAVTVAIDGGLITPVLQDADKVDIFFVKKMEGVG